MPMSNIKANVTIPDPIVRMIAKGYDIAGDDDPSRDETVAAFQEIINVLAQLMSSQFPLDMHDDMYFRESEENGHCWGYYRVRTPRAEAIGKSFLAILGVLVNAPVFEQVLNEENRRGDDPDSCDPGGGMRGPDHEPDDDQP
jgi:hypothetical protein